MIAKWITVSTSEYAGGCVVVEKPLMAPRCNYLVVNTFHTLVDSGMFRSVK